MSNVGFNISYDPQTIANLNRALASYVKDLGMEQKDVIHQWAGNLSVELMKETAPFTKGRHASNGQDARKRGIESLENNFKRAVITPDIMFGKQEIKNEKLRKALKSGRKDKVQGMLHGMGFDQWKVVDFNKSLHTDVRPIIYRRLKTQYKVTTNKRSWNDYLKRLKDKVGLMKAGWAISAEKLGKKVPKWIANNIFRAHGSCVISGTELKPQITLNNYTRTVARYGGRYNHAIQWMFEKMQKDIKIRLRYLANKYKK